MKKVKNTYENGKIYKICSFQTDKIYIGSTYENRLSNRLCKHVSQYKAFQNEKSHYITSFEILKYDDHKIILIENYPCNSKEELLAKELEWILKSNCVNKQNPTRTAKQYRNDNKLIINKRSKEYYDQNKEVIHTKQKKYNQKNKDSIQIYQKEYADKHKQELLDYKKVYNQKLTKCITCNIDVKNNSLHSHNKSKKHINQSINAQTNSSCDI